MHTNRSRKDYTRPLNFVLSDQRLNDEEEREEDVESDLDDEVGSSFTSGSSGSLSVSQFRPFNSQSRDVRLTLILGGGGGGGRTFTLPLEISYASPLNYNLPHYDFLNKFKIKHWSCDFLPVNVYFMHRNWMKRPAAYWRSVSRGSWRRAERRLGLGGSAMPL